MRQRHWERAQELALKMDLERKQQPELAVEPMPEPVPEPELELVSGDPYRGRRIFTWRCDGVKSDWFGGTHRYICWTRWALELALVASSLAY